MRIRGLTLIALSFLAFSACENSQPTAAPKPTEPIAKAKTEPDSKPSAEESPKPTPHVKRGEVTQMSLEQFFLMRSEGKLLVVDVRLPIQYRLGHIDGAINLPLASFEKSYPKVKSQLDAAVAAGKVIALYCDGPNCANAHNTGIGLADRGYSSTVYIGGWEEWKSAGME